MPSPFRSVAACLGLALLHAAGCQAPSSRDSAVADAAVEAEPAPAKPDLSSEPSSEPSGQPSSQPSGQADAQDEPQAPSAADLPPPFDAKAVTQIAARIVDVYDRAGWAPCGVIHSVGAVEVEVLGYATPGPRMLLMVSCPVDHHPRSLLAVDNEVKVKLHTKRQWWPKPPKGYRTDLVVRYAKGIEDLEPSL